MSAIEVHDLRRSFKDLEAVKVDGIRQIFLGSNAALGVTVLGHTMTKLEEFAVVGGFSAVLLGAAVIAFNRQE